LVTVTWPAPTSSTPESSFLHHHLYSLIPSPSLWHLYRFSNTIIFKKVETIGDCYMACSNIVLQERLQSLKMIELQVHACHTLIVTQITFTDQQVDVCNTTTDT
jgi:hypothetical protein